MGKVQKIQKGDAPILRLVAEPVSPKPEERKSLAERLEATLQSTSRCAGLAAPQIGISKRAFSVKKDGRCTTKLNPAILLSSRVHVKSNERCMSFPNRRYLVKRSLWVVYRYEEVCGTRHIRFLIGKEAHVVEHEIDHLNGRCIDLGERVEVML